MEEKRYRQVQNFLKLQIQKGNFVVGSYLPSENELCTMFGVTRTTVRKGLDELTREGFLTGTMEKEVLSGIAENL